MTITTGATGVMLLVGSVPLADAEAVFRSVASALGDRVRRIPAARQVVPQFGIASECGFGRRPPESVAALLQVHAEVTE